MKLSWSVVLRIFLYTTLAFVAWKAVLATHFGGEYNGFDVSTSLIPAAEIMHGGPGRDGIPAIDAPKFSTALNADIKDDARVLGISLNGIARAYPVSILNWHEIVNDDFDGQKVTITYCPLCGTGMAFEADGKAAFGVSGLLYNSDMLLYDRKTESLWSQILGKAVSGQRKGEKLKAISMMHTDWSSWKTLHPDTKLLTRDTGYRRDYDRSPYFGYGLSQQLYFSVNNSDGRYANKENVIALDINGKQKVWPFSELKKARLPIADTIGKQKLFVHFDRKNDTAWVTDKQGELLPAIRGYWFAWMAFYPDSEVFQTN